MVHQRRSFPGIWVYAVQEYNGTATVIYTNGTLMVSNAQTYKPLSNSSTHELPFIIGSQTAYYFGGSTFSGDTRAEFWDGGVSHVAYYNSTLTDAQIANHYFSATNSGSAPSITSQPVSTTNNVGQTATFSVTASGSPAPSYQWKVESSGSYVNLSNGGQFSGATSATLTISSLALTNSTNYEVVVTNSAGAVTSSVAALTVLTNSSGLTAYQTIIIADAPVAFWPLNETSGTTIHDIAGTNNGTAENPSGLGLGGPGILYSNGVTTDLAIYFTNSSSGYISIPYNTNFVGSAALHLSVEAWLNMPTFPGSAQSANENPVGFCNGISASAGHSIFRSRSSNPHMYAWLAKGEAVGTLTIPEWPFRANGLITS